MLDVEQAKLTVYVGARYLKAQRSKKKKELSSELQGEIQGISKKALSRTVVDSSIKVFSKRSRTQMFYTLAKLRADEFPCFLYSHVS